LRDMPGYLSEYLTQRTMRSRMESLRVLSRVMTNRLTRLLSRRHDIKSQRMRAMLFDAWMEKRASQLPPRLGNVVQAHSMAVRNYIPQVYFGHVTIFRATSQVLFSSHFRDLGWGRLTKSVTIYRVPGAHGS